MLCPMRASSKSEWGAGLGVSQYGHQQKCCIFFYIVDVVDYFEISIILMPALKGR